MDNVNLVHVIFDRSQQNPDEDAAIFTCHIRGTLAGLPDSLASLTDEDRDAFYVALQNWWTTIKGTVSTKVVLSQVKFYELGASADEDMGPPVLIKNYGSAGTSPSQILPPQLALSVTFKHPASGGVGRVGSRWGRIYLPGLTTDVLTSNARFSSTAMTTICNATRDLALQQGGGGGCKLTIWSRAVWSHFDPNMVQVDDVPDVIRSRRFSTTTLRKTAAIT